MVEERRIRKWLSLILPLILAGFLLVGCDAGEEQGGGGGLGDETPFVDEGLGTEDDGLGTDVDDGLAETPMVEPTITVDVQSTEEATVAVETTEEPTVAVEPTAEMTATVEMDAATDASGAQPTDGQGLVVLASDLLGMNIQDSAGTDVALIDEILVDDTGTVQYVIVDALNVDTGVGDVTDDADVTDDGDADDANDNADDATTDTAAQDDADMTAGSSFALAWDAIEVQPGVQQETEPDVTVEDDQMFQLIYAGDVTMQDQMSFDVAILDEQGAVLDDQSVDDTDMTVPAEFVNLLQVSEYNEMDLTNNDGEDIGEIEDALVDLQEGRVTHVIVDVGGFLGIGERSVAVPFEAFQVDVTVADDAEEESITLNADTERLENAPEFNYDDWMPSVESNWDAEWNEFWSDLETSVDS